MKNITITILLILFLISFNINLCAQTFNQTDSTEEKPVQYRRGIELQEGYQSYNEKYSGKNLKEVKKSLFPLRSETGVWTELNPKIPRVDYLGIHFVNKDTGWACGDLGAIIKTTDGGEEWTSSETNTTTLILKVDSYDGQVVIATGYDGLILRSTDEGETFVEVESGVGSGTDLWGVKMLNDTLGFACGLYQTLLKTTDAGITWQQVSTGLNEHYWAIDFLDEQYGMIACGGGKILKTTDGGENWTIHQAGDDSWIFALDIIDYNHIAASGASGKNVYSSDGGETWIQNSRLQHDELNSIKFVDTETGYTIGTYGGDSWGIRKTTNRGVSWFSPPTGNLSEWELELLPDDVGYSVGSELWIYKTTNGYDNWEGLFLNANFVDVYFTGELTGYAADGRWTGGPLYKTTDGGENWFGLPNFPSNVFTSSLRCVTFTDSLTGFAGSAPCRIVKTTDAGKSWYIVNRTGLTDTIGLINKIYFINSTTGWAVTTRGGILKTTDAGENWFAQLNAGISVIFSSIYFVDSLWGWTTNFNARPYKTTDGGENWTQQINLNIGESDDIYFHNYLKGWIISGNKLYYTTNSGIEWIQDPQIYTYSRNFESISNTHFIITGTNIYESVDTGQVWQNITSEIGSYFTALHAPKDFMAYGVGPLGYIVSYLDTSIVPIELVSLTAEQIENKILLKWVTATETNNYGFEILRSSDLIKWDVIGFVPGNGSTSSKVNYSFFDTELRGDKHYYKLKQIDYNGSYEFSEIKTLDIFIDNYFLSQNYPNPANPTTTITFSIPLTTDVKIEIFSITGEKIKEILNEEKEKGIYKIDINFSNYASGIYLYKMTTKSGYTATKKITLIK